MRFAPLLFVAALWASEQFFSWTDPLSEHLDTVLERLDSSFLNVVVQIEKSPLASLDLEDAPARTNILARRNFTQPVYHGAMSPSVNFDESGHVPTDEELWGMPSMPSMPSMPNFNNVTASFPNPIKAITESSQVKFIFSLVDKLRIYSLILTLILMKMLIAYFVFQVTLSARLTACVWGVLTVCGFEVTIKTGKAIIKVVIFALFSGPAPAFTFIFIWCLQEFGIVDFGQIYYWFRDIMAARVQEAESQLGVAVGMDSTGDGKFDMKDVDKSLHVSANWHEIKHKMAGLTQACFPALKKANMKKAAFALEKSLIENDQGNRVNVGRDGIHYYCGKPAAELVAHGCNGICGPSDGLQCESCHRYNARV